MRYTKAVAAFLLFFVCVAAPSQPLFDETLSGYSTGSNGLGGGYLPVSFSIAKSARVQMLPEGEEKASLSFSSSYSLSSSSDSSYWDYKTGTPTSSWTNSGAVISSESKYYFNPTGSMSLSLSQKLDEWTYSVSLSSRYSLPQEALGGAASTAGSKLQFSTYDESSAKWTKKYTDKDAVYAYPWLYGERTNLNSWMGLSARRSIYTVKNLSSFNMSFSFEMGPWWMLNRVSNGGITLSDYYRLSASVSEEMVLKNVEQSISLRWLRISLSHSDTLSYTFGKIVPQNKLNSFRLRGCLSDSVSLVIAGPQILDSGTGVSMSVSYNNSLYFGGFENERSGKSRGLAYVSTLSSSVSLSVFGFISFYYGVSWNIANGYSSPSRLTSSSEVSMSLSL